MVVILGLMQLYYHYHKMVMLMEYRRVVIMCGYQVLNL